MDTYLSPAQKYKVVRRLKITRGQLGKIITMVESDQPCFKIVHQTRAVRFALKKVDQILLEEYLVYCLGDEIKREGLQQEIHRAIAMFKKLDG